MDELRNGTRLKCPTCGAEAIVVVGGSAGGSGVELTCCGATPAVVAAPTPRSGS